MKVALVHDWLTGTRGGEKVLEVFCEMFPEAPLYTLLHIPGSAPPVIENRVIHTSFLQRMPQMERRYRWYLPLMPRAIESFRLEGYDLILSSSHCVAKGITTGGAPHLCYLHTPMRYAWDMYGEYFNPRRFGPLTLFAIGRIMPYLRAWDVRTAPGVDRYIANSAYVAERARRIYGVEAEVIHPPVDVAAFPLRPREGREGYLMVSAFAPYKRVDLAIEAFNQLGRPLTIVGSGEDEARLRAMAGPHIRFAGAVNNAALAEHYGAARALIFPGEEDFGITPVEAMACGTPVIAYGKGGAVESVIPLGGSGAPATGLFFPRQSVEDIAAAVERFEAHERAFDTALLRARAQKFARPLFRERMEDAIERFLRGRRRG